jgi:hypothetical protein
MQRDSGSARLNLASFRELCFTYPCGEWPLCTFQSSFVDDLRLLRYQRKERQFRVALFFSAAALAGAFGGILAYGIGFMDGVGGLEGWNWM